jgi:deoxyribose-phosphate aldolase
VTPAKLLEDKHSVAAVIDHTLLKPEATASDIDRLCEEALLHCFASVCVNPFWVLRTSEILKGSPVKVCTVVGFPLGANATVIKKEEAREARAEGAEEIDMVLNVGALRGGNHDQVYQDILQVAQVARPHGGLLKVILETCLLTDDEKTAACRLAVEAGADFVKTSTGFSKSGATVADVRLMRSAVGPAVGVKASGGIRDFAALQAMINAGANRIGTSSGVHILKELDGAAPLPSGNY